MKLSGKFVFQIQAASKAESRPSRAKSSPQPPANLNKYILPAKTIRTDVPGSVSSKKSVSLVSIREQTLFVSNNENHTSKTNNFSQNSSNFAKINNGVYYTIPYVSSWNFGVSVDFKNTTEFKIKAVTPKTDINLK